VYTGGRASRNTHESRSEAGAGASFSPVCFLLSRAPRLVKGQHCTYLRPAPRPLPHVRAALVRYCNPSSWSVRTVCTTEKGAVQWGRAVGERHFAVRHAPAESAWFVATAVLIRLRLASRAFLTARRAFLDPRL